MQATQSLGYDFRQDFNAIAHAVVHRWLPDAANLTFELVNDPSSVPVEYGRVQDGSWVPDDTGPSFEVINNYHAIAVDDTESTATRNPKLGS
jgi:hypothetical protein